MGGNKYITDILKQTYRDGSGTLNLTSIKRIRTLPMNEIRGTYIIYSLTLSNTNLKQLNEGDIREFVKLISLNLFGTQLKCLPPNLSALSYLQYLTVSHNKLKELPTGFGGFPNLRILDLSINQLKELRPQFTQIITLNELYLSDNKLTSIPDEIGKLINLQVLSLRNNRLEQLPSTISQLTNLSTLYIQNNQLQRLPIQLATCTSLEILELYGNPLHPCILDAARTGIQYLMVFLQRPDYEKQLAVKVKRSRLARKRQD